MTSDDNSHASGIIEQLRVAEEDESLPDDHLESLRRRREQLEGEDGEVDTDGGRTLEYYLVDGDRNAVVAGPFADQFDAMEDRESRDEELDLWTSDSLEEMSGADGWRLEWKIEDVPEWASGDGDWSIGRTEVIPVDQLERTGENEHGPVYRCPRCEYEWISEYCDCSVCGWAGMCQTEFEGSDSVATDGGTTLERGPHEYDGDEDPAYWSKIIDDLMFVRGHRFELFCEDCGKCSSDGLIDRISFYFYCDCQYEEQAANGSTFTVSHNVQIVPDPVGVPTEWDVWGSAGVDASLEPGDDHATIAFEHEGEHREFRLKSDTYFDALTPSVATDGGTVQAKTPRDGDPHPGVYSGPQAVTDCPACDEPVEGNLSMHLLDDCDVWDGDLP